MKGAVLALFCAVALVSAELNENGCPINPYVDILKPHPICNKYYQCVQGELVERKCASDLSFNVDTQECDWAANVDCGSRPVAPENSEESGNDSNANGDSSDSGSDSNSNRDSSSEESGSNSSSNESGNDSDNNNNGNGNGDPSEAQEICAREGSNGVLVAHEDCNKFYKCAYGVPVALGCYPGLLYNVDTEECDWAENVKCDGRNQGGNGDNGNDNNGGNGDASKEDGGNDNNNSGENNSNEDTGNNSSSNENGNDSDNNNNGNGNGDHSQAHDICATEGSEGVLVAHENCNQFYKCSEGVPVTLNCPANLLYNYNNEQCDWPENVDCSGRDQGGNGDNGNDNNGENGDADKEDGENDNNNNNNSGNGNGDPSQAHDICATEGSEGVLVAHENCNQFYKCSEGVPVTLNCPANLLYNYNNEQCDWPENVDCSGRDQGGNGDNGNDNNGENGDTDAEDGENDNNNNNNSGNGNGDPSQAHDICATEGSEGVLVAHENCNQFYKCSEGVPVTLNCPANLLYNYNNEQCDWPDNVDCSGRDQGGNGDNGNDNNGENGDTDAEDGENDNNNNNNSGNGNGDPSQARDICAAEDSEGVLVAHENCNQFYKCSEGVPVTLDCPANLLYNYNNEQCDWPENVDCSGRDQGGNGDNGNDNNGGNGDKDEDEEADKEDGENNNNGGGNSDPSQAYDICRREDNVLVAHENCNQYYVCKDGLPVALNCNPNLVFNPATDQCDWPENVDCGNRRTFTSLNKHMRWVK